MADDILLQAYAGERGCACIRSYTWSDPEAVTFGRYQRLSGTFAPEHRTCYQPEAYGRRDRRTRERRVDMVAMIPRDMLDTDRVPAIFRNCQTSIRNSLELIALSGSYPCPIQRKAPRRVFCASGRA